MRFRLTLPWLIATLLLLLLTGTAASVARADEKTWTDPATGITVQWHWDSMPHPHLTPNWVEWTTDYFINGTAGNRGSKDYRSVVLIFFVLDSHGAKIDELRADLGALPKKITAKFSIAKGGYPPTVGDVKLYQIEAR